MDNVARWYPVHCQYQRAPWLLCSLDQVRRNGSVRTPQRKELAAELKAAVRHAGNPSLNALKQAGAAAQYAPLEVDYSRGRQKIQHRGFSSSGNRCLSSPPPAAPIRHRCRLSARHSLLWVRRLPKWGSESRCCSKVPCALVVTGGGPTDPAHFWWRFVRPARSAILRAPKRSLS